MPVFIPSGVPQPLRTPEQSLRVLRIVHGAMLAVVAILAGVAEAVPRSGKPVPEFVLYLLGGLGLAELAAAVVVRKLMVESSETTLQTDPTNQRALMKWTAGQTVSFVLCEAIAMYGFVLRLVGAPRPYALAFYAAGGIFLLLFTPRRP